ncbi:MAG: BCD family MFS transporter [Pseudomonadota bacterium]
MTEKPDMSARKRLKSGEPVPTLADFWNALGPRFLPFADAATRELPLGRLLRLSLFQMTVGMAAVLLNGTLNRVMIVELSVPAWLVSVMIALPLVFAPLRALIGHRSDVHVSYLGWRRVPFIWLGTMLQFGGLAIMPFALILLSADGNGAAWIGQAGAALAFLMVGAGMHTTQTAGLALATDLAPEESRPRVVALLYVMLLVGMMVSSLVFGALLADYSHMLLVRVVQGAAAVTFAVNLVALWKQEARAPQRTAPGLARPTFSQAWTRLRSNGRVGRMLVALGIGTAAFNMQDILLEPYGAEVLGLSVSGTTTLTALFSAGMLVGFALAARALGRDPSARQQRRTDPYRIAAHGCLVGLVAFAAVIFAGPLESALVFRVGATLIGLGGGLFSVAMLVCAMELAREEDSGIAIGAWGAVQATAAGLSIAAGGIIRDVTQSLGDAGVLGPAFNSPSIGYSVVYHFEIALLFAALIALGPVVTYARRVDGGQASPPSAGKEQFGLAEFPG